MRVLMTKTFRKKNYPFKGCTLILTEGVEFEVEKESTVSMLIREGYAIKSPTKEV